MGIQFEDGQTLTAAQANSLAQLVDLAAGAGAALIGTPDGTVQGDLDARPTSATLAASGGAGLVGTQLAATGSVLRTQAGKNSDTVSALDFGADPTGATDSYAAFTDAIAAAWFVVIPPGTYLVNSSVSRPAGVTIVGMGRAKTIVKAGGNFPVFETTGSSTNVLVGGGVQNMTLIGTYGTTNTNTASFGVSESWTNRSVHRDLEIYGCYVGMYGGQGLWQVTWDNITADGAGTQQNYIGFMLDSLPTTLPSGTSNAVIASNCIAQDVANAGFRLVNPNGSKFVNCEAEGMPYGWLIGNTSAGNYPIEFLHVANCLADTCSANGWTVQQGSNAVAATDMQFANIWAGNSGTGIYLDGCNGINWTNIQADGNQGAGVVLHNSVNCLVSSVNLNGNNTANKSGIGDVTVSGGSYNKISNVISNPATSGSVSLLESNGTDNNDFSDLTLYQGATLIGSNSTIRAARGYVPSNIPLTAGASPYTLLTYQYDAMITITATGGMTGLTVNGVSVSTSVGSSFFVKPGTTVVATWATTAPTFEVIPMV